MTFTNIMLPDKIRLTLLVIEDNPEFAANAQQAFFRSHNIILASDLSGAFSMIRSMKIDMILSDVHFPSEPGGKPKENIRELLFDTMERGIPICFVTQADHHGLTELNEEGYVAIRALNMDDLAQSLFAITKHRNREKNLFSQLKTANSKTITSDSKTSEIWMRALDMLRNACAQPKRPVAKAIDQVRGLGLSVTAKKGMPQVIPVRGGKK
ncbi:MAG: hypothetical protein GY852_02290 [bacterium]|nr:hypothetical protein [bacterium]